MGLRVRATFAVIAIAALSLTSLTGCSPDPDEPGTVQVTDGQPAKLEVEGVIVDVPGEAIEGSGTLSVKSGTLDGHRGWQIALTDGATLVGEATLTFEGEPQEGEPLPIVMYADDAGTLHPAEAVEQADNGAMVTTAHFSFWMVTWWNALVEPVKSAWAAAFSGLASDAAVNCPDAGAFEASDYITEGPGEDDDRASWCAGMGSSGLPELQVKNERTYPTVVEATSGLIIHDADSSIESPVAQLFTILGEGPTQSGNTLYPLFSGDIARYQVANGSLQGVKVSANPSAYAAQVLRFAVDTGVLVAGAVGKSVTAETISTTMEASNCVEGFGKMAGANPASADAVADYLQVSIDASFACLGSTMAKLYAGGALAGIVVGGLSWIVNGSRLVGSAGQAIGDMVSNIGNDYMVTISQNTRWLITSEGIGPARRGDSAEQIATAVGDKVLSCRGAHTPWFVTTYMPGSLLVVSFSSTPGDDVVDAPMTTSGVTLGTAESELVALGYAKSDSKIGPDSPDYRWEEDGVPFVAGVFNGVVYGIGVGQSFMPLEYCA